MGVGSAGISGADQPLRAVGADVVFVAEHQDGKVDRLERLRIGTLLRLRLGVFDRPAGVTILLVLPSRNRNG